MEPETGKETRMRSWILAVLVAALAVPCMADLPPPMAAVQVADLGGLGDTGTTQEHERQEVCFNLYEGDKLYGREDPGDSIAGARSMPRLE